MNGVYMKFKANVKFEETSELIEQRANISKVKELLHEVIELVAKIDDVDAKELFDEVSA